MHESFAKLRLALNEAAGQHEYTPNEFDAEDDLAQTADVIPFRS